MDFRHQLIPVDPVVVGMEFGRCDVREADLSTTIDATQEFNFPPAQPAVAVVEGFNFPIF